MWIRKKTLIRQLKELAAVMDHYDEKNLEPLRKWAILKKMILQRLDELEK